MAEFESEVPVSEVKNQVFVACRHVVMALRASDNNLDANLSKLLADLDSYLSTMGIETKTEVTGFNEIEGQFKEAEKKILSWESNQSMIWDAGPSEADGYFQAVYGLQTILAGLKDIPFNAKRKEKDVYNRATVALDVAMMRLSKELSDVLLKHKKPLQPQYMIVSSRGKGIVHGDSFVSLEDEAVSEGLGVNEMKCVQEDVDLVDTSIVPHIKAIANAMFACDYGREFFEAFINVRKGVLDEYLATLEIERLSCGDVLEMKWEDLNDTIGKWTRVLKIIIQVYLPSEKQLCEQILGEFESLYPSCFIEISRETVFFLLNFGEAVAMGSHTPEKLDRFLSMYQVSANILLQADNLFPEEMGSSLRIAFHELSKKLSDCTRETFFNFRAAVASDVSSRPFSGGGIHPLTRYVMNYFMLLPAYAETLNSLLKDLEVDDSVGIFEPDKVGKDIPTSTFSPMARHLRSIASTLEASLYRKAELYTDEPLSYIFMINNLHYMVQKVKGSELRLFFGDEWIKKHIARYQHYATNYERSTWSSILSLLRDDDSKTVLREKCRLFSLAFDGIYKNQTHWRVPDLQLREDLRISTSVKVIQSYRGFLGRNGSLIGERYIRYTCEDIQNMLLDLFEDSPRSLLNTRRR